MKSVFILGIYLGFLLSVVAETDQINHPGKKENIQVIKKFYGVPVALPTYYEADFADALMRCPLAKG